ncbi:hypothetical protein GF377_09895 [candidate division GN15 bacterium]|nr:hypothetical protein [candidate division GN15 bacterium]
MTINSYAGNGLSGFFASLAHNYRNHYLGLARDAGTGRTPDHYRGVSRASNRTSSGSSFSIGGDFTPYEQLPNTGSTKPVDRTQRSAPVDKYEPSNPATKPANQDDPDAAQPSQSTPVKTQPNGTYSYERRAEMAYKLDLKFSLGAVTKTVERLAAGDEQAVEEFAAAAFGLKANFALKGKQEVKSSDVEGLTRGRNRVWSANGSRESGRMHFSNRTVGLDSFYRESTKVKRDLDETVRDSHRRAVNRFAMRYSFDNSFRMSFLNRFNVQTREVAEKAPEATKQYVDTAGEVAAKGSTEMMAGFFDAVDSYLDSAEQHLTSKVSNMLSAAAEELGFSGVEAAFAEEHLTSTIEGFFGRVDQALAAVEARFATPLPEGAQPAQMATQYYNPAQTEASREVAVA